MQWHALLQAGIVQEVILVAAGEPPLAERFHPVILARIVPAPADVAPGWVQDATGALVPPPIGPSLDEARAARDAALRASDWTQLADAPLTDARRRQWASYRAALRALPQRDGFPACAWPAAPGA